MLQLRMLTEPILKEHGYGNLHVERISSSIYLVGPCGKIKYNLYNSQVQLSLTKKERDYLFQIIKDKINSSEFSMIMKLHDRKDELEKINSEYSNRGFFVQKNYLKPKPVASVKVKIDDNNGNSSVFVIKKDYDSIKYSALTDFTEYAVKKILEETKEIVLELDKFSEVTAELEMINNKINKINTCNI